MAISRITSNIIFNNFLRNIQRNSSDLIKSQEKIASGSEIQRPSDDPATTNRILTLRSSLALIKQFLSNTRYATSRLQAADSVLSQVSEILLRARDLALEGLNASASQADRDALASEINQLLEGLVDHSNASFGEISLFAGNETSSAAFESLRPTPDGEITEVRYLGDQGEQKHRIGLNAWIVSNVPGTAVFGEGKDSLFNALITLRDALRRSSLEETRAMVDRIEDYHKRIADLQADIGGRWQRLDINESRLLEEQDATQQLLSHLEEIDITEVITHFRQQESIYAAVLSSGARILRLSLFNFV